MNIVNRKVSYEYHILDKYDCGIQLIGNEIKTIKSGHIGFTDTYCYFKNNELFLRNIMIGGTNCERKLLLKKNELKKLKNSLIDGVTIVPIRIFENQKKLIKVEICLAKGKKLYDKRNDIKKKDLEREIKQQLK